MSHIRLDAADTAELVEILEHLIDHFNTIDHAPDDHALADITDDLARFRDQLLTEKILP